MVHRTLVAPSRRDRAGLRLLAVLGHSVRSSTRSLHSTSCLSCPCHSLKPPRRRKRVFKESIRRSWSHNGPRRSYCSCGALPSSRRRVLRSLVTSWLEPKGRRVQVYKGTCRRLFQHEPNARGVLGLVLVMPAEQAAVYPATQLYGAAARCLAASCFPIDTRTEFSSSLRAPRPPGRWRRSSPSLPSITYPTSVQRSVQRGILASHSWKQIPLALQSFSLHWRIFREKCTTSGFLSGPTRRDQQAAAQFSLSGLSAMAVVRPADVNLVGCNTVVHIQYHPLLLSGPRSFVPAGNFAGSLASCRQRCIFLCNPAWFSAVICFCHREDRARNDFAESAT